MSCNLTYDKQKISDDSKLFCGKCAILDSGASGHFFRETDSALLERIESDRSAMVSMPNGTTIRSTTSGSLKLSGIPPEARKAYTFGELTEWSLLSLGQLCDAGMTAILDKHSVSVTLGDDVVLSGHRNDSTNGMWMIDFTKPQSACNLYPAGTLARLVSFYHGSF